LFLCFPVWFLLAEGEVGFAGFPGFGDFDEDLLATARREFREETSFDDSAERYIPLGEVVQKSGKRVLAWAFQGTCNPSALRSNTFQIEWPPRSGNVRQIPEVDRAAFFNPSAARDQLASHGSLRIGRRRSSFGVPREVSTPLAGAALKLNGRCTLSPATR